MKMIRHDNISQYIVISLFQNLKPVINDIITICFLNKGKPLVTGECYEINSFFIDRFLKRHEPKIHIFAHVADESGYRTMPTLTRRRRNIKPIINGIIAICFLNKCKPSVTGECYEINSFFIDRLLKRHEPKIHIFAHVADESSGLPHNGRAE